MVAVFWLIILVVSFVATVASSEESGQHGNIAYKSVAVSANGHFGSPSLDSCPTCACATEADKKLIDSTSLLESVAQLNARVSELERATSQGTQSDSFSTSFVERGFLSAAWERDPTSMTPGLVGAFFVPLPPPIHRRVAKIDARTPGFTTRTGTVPHQLFFRVRTDGTVLADADATPPTSARVTVLSVGIDVPSAPSLCVTVPCTSLSAVALGQRHDVHVSVPVVSVADTAGNVALFDIEVAHDNVVILGVAPASAHRTTHGTSVTLSRRCLTTVHGIAAGVNSDAIVTLAAAPLVLLGRTVAMSRGHRADLAASFYAGTAGGSVMVISTNCTVSSIFHTAVSNVRATVAINVIATRDEVIAFNGPSDNGEPHTDAIHLLHTGHAELQSYTCALPAHEFGVHTLGGMAMPRISALVFEARAPNILWVALVDGSILVYNTRSSTQRSGRSSPYSDARHATFTCTLLYRVRGAYNFIEGKVQRSSAVGRASSACTLTQNTSPPSIVMWHAYVFVVSNDEFLVYDSIGPSITGRVLPSTLNAHVSRRGPPLPKGMEGVLTLPVSSTCIVRPSSIVLTSIRGTRTGEVLSTDALVDRSSVLQPTVAIVSIGDGSTVLLTPLLPLSLTPSVPRLAGFDAFSAIIALIGWLRVPAVILLVAIALAKRRNNDCATGQTILDSLLSVVGGRSLLGMAIRGAHRATTAVDDVRDHSSADRLNVARALRGRQRIDPVDAVEQLLTRRGAYSSLQGSQQLPAPAVPRRPAAGTNKVRRNGAFASDYDSATLTARASVSPRRRTSVNFNELADVAVSTTNTCQTCTSVHHGHSEIQEGADSRAVSFKQPPDVTDELHADDGHQVDVTSDRRSGLAEPESYDTETDEDGVF